MSSTEKDIVDLTLVLHDARWRKLIPDTEQYARAVILTTLESIKSRVPSPKKDRSPEIACLFTNDAEIRILNRQFRGKDGATNVLSFAADRNAPAPDEQPVIIGDLILSIDTIEREANDQGKSFRNHTSHMLVHGVLHLFDYDHQHDAEAEDMERLEREILKKLDISDPYDFKDQKDAIA
ncbi:MAG: rRNA maturation RNase YbeY [Rickettsiales bacterium]